MKTFSEKVYLQLTMPTEDVSVSDEKRIRLALETLGYGRVAIPLEILRKLYPMCRNAGFEITVTLVRREHDWVITDAEPGDTRHSHYGLAVDCGSTTILMQLVDPHSGTVVAEEKAINGQTAYGTDILTRITYAMADPSHADDLQRATTATFDGLLAALAESTRIDASRCPIMILSGNTAMIHFLLRMDAWTVFCVPLRARHHGPGLLPEPGAGYGF